MIQWASRCAVCGRVYEVTEKEAHTVGWICEGCRVDGRVSVREHEADCAVCGAGIVGVRSDKRYCTPRCQARAWRARHPRPVNARACDWCGASLTHRRFDARFCSDKCRVSSWRAGRSAGKEAKRRVTGKR